MGSKMECKDLAGRFVREKKYAIEGKHQDRFFVWNGYGDFREVKTRKNAFGKGRDFQVIPISDNMVASFFEKKILYIDIHTGEIRNTFKFPEGSGFITLEQWIYVLSSPGGLTQVKKTTRRVGENLYLDPVRKFGLYDDIFGLVTVGGNIFVATRTTGILLNKNLDVLKTFPLPRESTSRVSSLGDSKVVILGKSSFAIDLETEEVTELTKNDSLVQVLTFPSGKVLLVIENPRLTLEGVSEFLTTKIVIYKDNTFETLLGKFTGTEHVGLAGHTLTVYAVLEETRLLAAIEGGLGVVNIGKVLSGSTDKSIELEIECESQGSDFGNTITPISLPGHEARETAAFLKFIMDFSPLDRDTAGVIAGFI
jgi:hypothetical protein